MSDFPDSLPSFEKAKERADPKSVKLDSKAVTEQMIYAKLIRNLGKQRQSLVKAQEKSYKSLQARLQKSKSFDYQSPKELASMKVQHTQDVVSFDTKALDERHEVHRRCLEVAQEVQMNDLEKLHKSDLDTMHKDLAALIKRLSKSAQISGKKQRVVTKSDLEEKAIKLGKTLRGEFAKLHAAERTKLIESQELEAKRLLEMQGTEHSKLGAITECDEATPSSIL
jgi:hypothetical protein